jgi:PKD repeat protein
VETPDNQSLIINDINDVTGREIPLKVKFTADVSGTPIRIAGNSISEGLLKSDIGKINPVFTQEGTYDVTLTAKDAAGHTGYNDEKSFH